MTSRQSAATSTVATASPAAADPMGGRMVQLLRPYATRLGLVVLMLSLLAMTNMALPYLVKLLIDDVFPKDENSAGNWALLWVILPGLAFIYVARNILFYSGRMVSVRISEDLCFSMRRRLFDHLQQVNLRFYKSHQAGKVSSRVMDDTFKIQSFIQDKLPTLLLNVLMFQILIVILYAVNWRLALASTIVLPFHFLAYRWFRVPIKKSHSKAQELLSNAYGNLVEKFLGMEVVKGFSGESRESASFRHTIDASRQSQIESQRYTFAQKVVADLLVGTGTVVLFGFGAYEVWRGAMSAGTFFMFFGYVTMLYPAVLEVISGSGHLTRTSASAERVYEMLDVPTGDAGASDDAVADQAFEGEIVFDNVGFAYEDGARVLNGLSFRIPAGQHVAITGPSGSGKSTMLSLLPRFNDPTSGEVRIDGRNIRDIPIPALRRAIGLAFQEVFLFDASIYENLRYARDSATLEEVEEVCRVTGAHDCVAKLSNGYETRIGASGVELSRGEKQRITLARALVKNPQILILDEATASIDSRSARDAIQTIFERMAGRTVIMVTHETELLDLADRVISISDGRVDFDGTPLEFAAAMGRGIRIWPEAKSVRQTETPSRTLKAPSGEAAMPRRSIQGGLASLLLLLTVSVLGGCLSTQEKQRSVELVEPKASTGIMTDEASNDGWNRLAEALAEADHQWTPPPGFVLRDGRLAPVNAADGAFDLAPPGESIEPSPPPTPAPAWGNFPADSGRLINLTKLSATEVVELIDRLAMKFQTEQGYLPAPATMAGELPPPPGGILGDRLLVRPAADGTRHVLRFGYKRYLSQPPQLWVFGVVLGGDAVATNPAINDVGPVVEATLGLISESRQQLTPTDLKSEIIQLSYTDAASAMGMLKSFGVTTILDPNTMPATVAFEQLPLVVQMPSPRPEDMALVGSASAERGGFGVSIAPTAASPLPPNVTSSPVLQLLVMFHPAHPEQFSHVQSILDQYIDRPDRQIFIEGMVLEISEDGLEDLGIEWEFQEGPIQWMLGTLNAGGLEDSFSFTRQDSANFEADWSVQIRALIRDGKAEILSRPSVLTLNNRQATIRVGEDIPIATSQEGLVGSSNKIAFNFTYLPTGILLNVRPRVADGGDEVSMLVDTIVSATVPGRDLEIRSTDGELLASAPTVSTRRVQTYARIENNTPFIIGGLVSRDLTITQDKVPLLGDLPILGYAFRAQRTRETKREVIIVLTPYVLPEERIISRSLPKDEDLFDSFGNELYRSAYRIRAEDVFDLAFLLENRRLQGYKAIAEQVIRSNYVYASVAPFSAFVDGRIPAEDILVHRMIYEVAKRLELDREVDPERIIFFGEQQVGGYDVQFLDRALGRLAGGDAARDFFRKRPNKALAITFTYDRESLAAEHLASEPIPDVMLVDVPDRETWGKLLWELNQPTEDGRRRYTVLIQNEGDLLRLRRAIMLKKIVELNGGQSEVSLNNFSIGKLLLIPDLKPGQVTVIDSDVAKYFFHTEHYYSAAIRTIEQTLQAVDEAIRGPELQPYLNGVEIPAR